jgi:hypothetical protein
MGPERSTKSLHAARNSVDGRCHPQPWSAGRKSHVHHGWAVEYRNTQGPYFAPCPACFPLQLPRMSQALLLPTFESPHLLYLLLLQHIALSKGCSLASCRQTHLEEAPVQLLLHLAASWRIDVVTSHGRCTSPPCLLLLQEPPPTCMQLADISVTPSRNTG